MDVRFNHLSQQIFNKSLEDCSEQEIRSFAEQHPYFSPAQFLLLKKLDKNSEAYQTQYQKAILYYHDPVAFDFLLNAEEYDTDIEKEEIGSMEITSNQEEIIATSKDEVISKSEAEIIPGSEPKIYKENIHEEKSKPALQEHSEVGQEINNQQDYQENIHEEKKQVKAFAEQTTLPAEELSFEPFHTVDYFASVGVKLSQEEVTKDRMGKQLKSFTEWLKTMKRLPAPELEREMTGHNERKVENMATDSVQNADVVTEAMAEVWIKQENAAKAIEVYNKLSLQNPSKSAYFAAKIEHLK